MIPLRDNAEGAFLGRLRFHRPPLRPARDAPECVVRAASLAPAARGEILVITNLPTEGGRPHPHYAAFPERRPIHSDASSRVNSATFFPTISSNFGTPSSTTSPINDSR